MSDNMTVGNNSVVITNIDKLPSGPLAIGVGVTVIGYGTFDDVLRRDLIELLEACKRDHYTDYAGVNDCDYDWTNGKSACTCGASELNAKIDAMILKLTR